MVKQQRQRAKHHKQPSTATVATHRELLQEGGREVQQVYARPLQEGPQQLHQPFPDLVGGAIGVGHVFVTAIVADGGGDVKPPRNRFGAAATHRGKLTGSRADFSTQTHYLFSVNRLPVFGEQTACFR